MRISWNLLPGRCQRREDEIYKDFLASAGMTDMNIKRIVQSLQTFLCSLHLLAHAVGDGDKAAEEVESRGPLNTKPLNTVSSELHPRMQFSPLASVTLSH